MCDPVSIGITAMAVLGSATSAISSYQQSRASAKVAERNAVMEAEAANTAQKATRQEALAHYRRVAQIKGQQQAAMAANGIDTNFGTSGDIKDDTTVLAQEDAGRIYDQGASAVKSYDINAANYRAQASASRKAGTGALIKGGFDIGSSILGSVSQYNKAKAG